MPATATAPTTQKTTIPMTTQTHVLILPAIARPQQPLRLVQAHRILTLLTQTLGLPRLAGGRGAIATLQRHTRELHARPATYPRLSIRAGGALQVGPARVDAAERNSRGAAL